MEKHLPFFNFSIKKVLALEPDPFKRAKLQIVFTLLILTVIKFTVVLFIALHFGQYRQFFRALLGNLLIMATIKGLLYKPSAITAFAHMVMGIAVATVWSNIFFYVQHINIVSVQFIYMVTLCSYYLIGGWYAAAYTMAAILPVLLYVLTNGAIVTDLGFTPQELVERGADFMIILNFLTFGVSHYLYYKAVHQNLVEKELLNEQLQANIREVKALAESRSVFLSTMSHELRTPLNGVIGMTHLLKDSAYAEQKENLNILEFSANNLLSVINDILDYNKSEVDKIELEVIPVDLHALLRKISFGMEVRAAEKALTWKLDLDSRLADCMVVTDPTRLTQIIYNISGNALKFTDEGMVTVKVDVLETIDDKISVKFAVSDTGIGIPADRQGAIFDPFTQGSTDTTRHYGGTGLGLAIVKRLLKLFHSDISLHSVPLRGSTFSFVITFDLHLDHVQQLMEVKPEKAAMPGLKALIVEDNQINIMVLEKLLSKWKVQTATAKNGQEAVDKASAEAFDVILMDLHMPVMDGYDAARAIRTFTDPVKAGVHIIAITASVTNSVNDKTRAAGIYDYLPKPFQADQLYEKLQQVHATSKAI